MKDIRDIKKTLPGHKADRIIRVRERMSQAKANWLGYQREQERAHEEKRQFVARDRRNFLSMIAKAGISMPVLRASSLLAGLMATRHAMAAGPELRVVYCYINSGARNDQWLPASASNMNNVSQPYAGVASVCRFRQVDALIEGHGAAAHALGGINNSGGAYGIPTYDQRIAEVLGGTTPIPYIYAGSDAGLGVDAGPNTMVSTTGPFIDSPAALYEKVFNSKIEVGTDTTYESAFAAQYEAITSIKSKLSSEELIRLEEHEQALMKIEENIRKASEADQPDQASCSATYTDGNNIVDKGKAQADIIVAAMKCGLTKVATLQLGNHQGAWRGHDTAYQGDAHNSCHSSGPETNDEMMRYIHQVPAYFIKRLMDEGLINTTAFVQTTCMGNGRNHSTPCAPVMVASGLPGFSRGFSSQANNSSVGNIRDFNRTIPMGMGLSGGMFDAPSNTINLL
ncbi:DUF1552 domain-containing protein [Marinagarivorans cellulosilyticus]|uniref:DUF1552 domain-containing protein n=1 Tax=Marinagarivorans cellulosilyticus TaxID=2721545 RepID=A0AAN1WFX9_9GAMM|nr:DUF1552 domain-containing protein [Marinagarivorans cellulosilyticus]BCD96881.1 hypothetical protein MARGE09_P1081 [Marinagarivorans cellulosilyticus]